MEAGELLRPPIKSIELHPIFINVEEGAAPHMALHDGLLNEARLEEEEEEDGLTMD